MFNSWNTRLKCINKNCEGIFTKDKIYVVKNGRFVYDNGERSCVYESYEDYSKSNPSLSKYLIEIKETPFQEIMRTRFGIVEGDSFNLSDNFGYSCHNPFTLKGENFVSDGVELGAWRDAILLGRDGSTIHKIEKPEMVEITIDGKTFKISKESADEFKRQFTE